MKTVIYQNNLGSASGIHWWLANETNVGPQLYSFTDAYLRPAGDHVGGIVIEDSSAELHSTHKESLLILDTTTATGELDVLAPFTNVADTNHTEKHDMFLWSNFGGNLLDTTQVIKADKTILVDNTPEEQLFCYISQYACSWIDSIEDLDEQTTEWVNDHPESSIFNDIWLNKHKEVFHKAFTDGTLKYMWQLNFAHHDLANNLKSGGTDTQIPDADDHGRLFEVKRNDIAEQSMTDTLFEYSNREIDHIVVGDDWFKDKGDSILSYLDMLNTFRLKKFYLDYHKMYMRKKVLYEDKFSKHL